MSKPAGGRVLRPEPETSSGALLRQPIAGRSRRVLLRAPDHRGPEPTDALTMHEDRWAYCSAGKSESHDWQPTGAYPSRTSRDSRSVIRAAASIPKSARRPTSVRQQLRAVLIPPTLIASVYGCQASSRNEGVLDVTTPPAGWSPWPAARAHWGRWGGLSERSLRTTSLNATCGGLCVAATFQLTDAEQ